LFFKLFQNLEIGPVDFAEHSGERLEALGVCTKKN